MSNLKLSLNEILYLQDHIKDRFFVRKNKNLATNSSLTSYQDLAIDFGDFLKTKMLDNSEAVLRKLFYDIDHAFFFRSNVVDNFYRYIGQVRPTEVELLKWIERKEKKDIQESPNKALEGVYYTYNISSANQNLFRGIAKIYFDAGANKLQIDYKAPGNSIISTSTLNYDKDEHLYFEVMDEGIKVSFNGKVLSDREVQAFTLAYASISRIHHLPIAGFEKFVKQIHFDIKTNPFEALTTCIVNEDNKNKLDANELTIWDALKKNPPLSLSNCKEPSILMCVC